MTSPVTYPRNPGDFLVPQTDEGIELHIKKMINLEILNENFNPNKQFIHYLRNYDVSSEDYLHNPLPIIAIQKYIHPKWVNSDQLGGLSDQCC
jgi:hypothetical protein